MTNQAVGEVSSEQLRKKTFERNKWLFSVGGIGRDMVYQLIAAFLLVYIQFGIPLTLAQFATISLAIGVGGRIWDALNDPIMGAIIESSHLKWGKFKPWIFYGAVSCGITIIAMFNVQSTFVGWGFVAFMIVIYLLWESTFTMNDIGYWSMLPSLSSVTKERNSATMLTVLFAGVGAIIAQGVIPILTTGNMRTGYRMVSIGIVIIFIAMQAMTAFGVKESPRTHESGEKVTLKKMFSTIKKNDQILWMTLSMLFYNISSALITALIANLLYVEIRYDGSLYFYMVVAFGVTSVAVNIIYPWLVGKLGRKRLQFCSIIVAIIGYALIATMGWGSRQLNIAALASCAVLISCGQSLFYMSSIVNMTNCVEYNDYKQGQRNEAVVSTLRPFMAKFAAALQTLIVTLVLTTSGVYLLSQSISTLETQKDMFGYIETPEQKIEYIMNVQSYSTHLSGIEVGSAQYETALAEVNDMIAQDSLMSSKQLDPMYVDAMTDAVIVLSNYGEDGKLIDTVILGRLGELTETELRDALAASGTKSDLGMEVGKVDGLVGDSAADENFHNKATLSMRIWLRVAVTTLPICFLFIAWIIQRKKFIIDEQYYDMMCAEIARRDGKAQESAE